MTERELIDEIRRRMTGFGAAMLTITPPEAPMYQIVIAENVYLQELAKRLTTDLVTPAAAGVLIDTLRTMALLTPPITDRNFTTAFANAIKTAVNASADPDPVPATALDTLIATLAS